MTDTIKSKSRGRPRKLDAESGLSQATDLFLASGFDNVSIAEVCQNLATQPTSLYATFGNKLALYTLCLTRYSEQYFLLFDKLLDDSESVPELIRNALEFSVDLYLVKNQRRGCLLLLGQANCKDDAVIKLVAKASEQIAINLTSRLEQLGAENAEELASVLLTLMRGLALGIQAGVDEDAVYTSLEFYCAMFDSE